MNMQANDQFNRINTGVVLEVLAGLFGFLGIGYLYAGFTNEGIKRLILYFIGLTVAWIFTGLLILVVVGVCLIPVMLGLQVGIPIWSAMSLKKQGERLIPVGGPVPMYGYSQLPVMSEDEALIERARRLYESGDKDAAIAILRTIKHPRAQEILARIQGTFS